MLEESDVVYELTYPYLSQLFGLSGWLVFTQIILTTDPDFERKAHVNLKLVKHIVRIMTNEGQLIEQESYKRPVKEAWQFYWDKPIYEEWKFNWQNQVHDITGKFQPLLKKALIDDLSKEKLCGYIFREPILHFSQSDVVQLECNKRK